MKLSTAVEQYLNDCRIRGHAAETIQAYKSDLTLLVSLASVRAADSVLAFTPELARAFFLMLSEKGLSMATLHRRKATVTGFAKWGHRRRFWAEDPTAELPMIKRPRRLPRPFDSEEIKRLMALELPPQERALRALLYYTGLRITPISRIRLGDLSFSPTMFSNGLEVPGSVRALSKGNKPSVKPMHQDLWSTLRDWLLPTLEPGRRDMTADLRKFIFVNRHGGAWSRDRMLGITHRWGRDAGVAKCLPHRFRHTFATTLLEQGADIRLVQLLLDHEDLNSTQIYTRVSDARLGKVVMNLPTFGVLSESPVSQPQQAVEPPRNPAE